MILKIVRQRQFDDGKEGKTSLITEMYSGNTYKELDGFVDIGNNKDIPITSYDLPDDLSGKFNHYETLQAFLMNDEGKTIERLN